jgi:sulfonate transport system substrate-binding protein
MPQTRLRARPVLHRVLARLTALVALTGLAAGVTADAASARTSKTATLTGVTITFGDQLKEFQTIFAATDALKGAPYTVNWANFIGGPPVIAAETSGSVDLGDMAETPTIFAQSAGDPVKVVAATEGVNPRVSPYDILVPANSPIKTVAQLRGHSIAVQEGTVEQYFLVQVLGRAGIPYHAVTVDNLSLTSASTAVTSGQVDAAVVTQPLTGLDLATGKVRQLVSGAGYLQTLGYLTASDAALANPEKAAALTDLIERFSRPRPCCGRTPGSRPPPT